MFVVILSDSLFVAGRKIRIDNLTIMLMMRV